MAYLPWIADDALVECVSFMLDKALEAKEKADKQFGKNVIDPFTASFEIAGFGLEFDDWFNQETGRQAQKTLQNHVGTFHQNILGSVNGWANQFTGSASGIDLVSEKENAIAEVKNKHNTVTAAKLVDVYNTLDALVMPKSSRYNGYTAYFVTIVPKRKVRYIRHFTPSNSKTGTRCPENDKILELDGASFYTLVTGDDNALSDLFSILPVVINDISGNDLAKKSYGKLRAYFDSAFGK